MISSNPNQSSILFHWKGEPKLQNTKKNTKNWSIVEYLIFLRAKREKSEKRGRNEKVPNDEGKIMEI